LTENLVFISGKVQKAFEAFELVGSRGQGSPQTVILLEFELSREAVRPGYVIE